MAYYKTDKGILKEEYDDCCDVDSPREYNDFSVFLTFDRNYNSPDKNEYPTYKDLVIDLVGEKADEIYTKDGVSKGNEYILSYLTKRGYAAMPVYKYEHSGVVYKAATANPFYDDWDSCLIGIIFATPEEIKKSYNVLQVTPKLVKEVQERLIEEVKYYSEWASENIKIYSLYSDKDDEPEVVGGFIGDMEDNGVFDCFGITKCEYIGEYYDE